MGNAEGGSGEMGKENILSYHDEQRDQHMGDERDYQHKLSLRTGDVLPWLLTSSHLDHVDEEQVRRWREAGVL